MPYKKFTVQSLLWFLQKLNWVYVVWTLGIWTANPQIALTHRDRGVCYWSLGWFAGSSPHLTPPHPPFFFFGGGRGGNWEAGDLSGLLISLKETEFKKKNNCLSTTVCNSYPVNTTGGWTEHRETLFYS